MATVTGLTASRMLEIEANSVVDGEVVAGNLILSKQDGSQINAGSVVGPQGPQGPQGPAGANGASPLTGDYKISAQNADHQDSLGGTWYLCDGRASPHANLTALVGANLPDSIGRSLVMKGTHADVNAIGKNDGVVAASRRPKHKHTVPTQPTFTTPDHTHGVTPYRPISGGNSALSGNITAYEVYDVAINNTGGVNGGALANTRTADVAVGVQTDTPTDQPAFVVPGNLFIYLAP